MSDVAALARVSLTTVSRVINGFSTVDDDLAARVRRAAETLDYRHNLTASSLRRTGGRTRTVGLVLEDVANPFSSAIHRAVEDVARARDVAVLAGSVNEDPDQERALIESLVARRVDGLIIVPAANDQSYLLKERAAGISMVFVDRPARFLDADSVVAGNEDGVRDGIRHLVAHGHRRIGYLGDLPGIASAAARHRGYASEITAQGWPLDNDLVRMGLRTVDAADAAVTELLGSAQPPTAMFAAQNLLTIGAFRALRRAGRHREVALVGFDDFPLADLLEPAITVVAQDPLAIATAGAELLFRRLDGDESPSEHIVIPTRLIVRGSGELGRPG